MSDLFIPEIDPEADSLTIALELAKAGIYVLPTSGKGDAKHAGSVLGRGWPSQSSTDPEQIAAWFAGTDHRVAVHCGRSGLIVADVDHAEKLTPELRRAVDELAPPFQSTRPDEPTRGHSLFAQPPGRRMGNRAGQTGRAWGEWRGLNGIILVGGAGRRWLRTGPVPVLPDYVASLLPDVGDTTSAVSDAEVSRFVDQHKLMLHPSSLQRILGSFTTAVADGASRHETATAAACWLVREAMGGLFSAGPALRKLEGEFVPALVEAGRVDSNGVIQPISRTQAEAEFGSIVAWAVAQEWKPTSTEASEPGPGDEDQPERLDPAAALQERAREIQIQQRMETLAVNAEAQRRHDEARRPARPSIADRVVSFADLATVPPPRMLIARLMPESSVGFLNGRSGAYKSFVLTALAMAIGTGQPAMGREEFRVARRGRVLYVAGEGSSGVALRIRAYASAHGIDQADVALFPGAVNLASEADVQEVYAFAADSNFSHVFVDTFRANTVGVQEKDSTEVGVVIGGAIRARDEHDISTLYADHTGHAGERAVGAESKWANVDYALMIHMPSDSRRADQQRTLKVEKFKDLETTGEWRLRLRAVPEVRDADGNPSAVIELGEVGGGSAVFTDHEWWFDEVPADLAGEFAGKAGRKAALDIVRILRHVQDEDGLTVDELRQVLNAGPSKPSPSSLRAGVALLKNTDTVTQGRTPSRLVLADKWWPKPVLAGVS